MSSPGRYGLVKVVKGLRHDWLHVLADVATAGPVVAPPWWAPLPVRAVTDPGAAREVLLTDAVSYRRPSFVTGLFGAALGDVLFNAEGDTWKTRQRAVAPAFARAHADSLVRTMADTIADELDQWASGRHADIQPAVNALTLRVAATALLGVDIAEDDSGRRLADAFERLLAWLSPRLRTLVAVPPSFPTPANRRFRHARRQLEDIVGELIDARRRQPDDRTDVLAMLLTQHAASDEAYTDRQLVDDCIGFLFGGYETTAAAITWALYTLAREPAWEERVAAEGRRLPERHVGPDDLASLHDTGLVVNEILRLYPPSLAIARSAATPTTLAGTRIRRHTLTFVSVATIHRNPALWAEPTTFDPERRDRNGATVEDSDAFLPFGIGARKCLGARFALTEAQLALAAITARWRVHLDPDQPTPKAEPLPALRITSALPITLAPR